MLLPQEKRPTLSKNGGAICYYAIHHHFKVQKSFPLPLEQAFACFLSIGSASRYRKLNEIITRKQLYQHDSFISLCQAGVFRASAYRLIFPACSHKPPDFFVHLCRFTLLNGISLFSKHTTTQVLESWQGTLNVSSV